MVDLEKGEGIWNFIEIDDSKIETDISSNPLKYIDKLTEKLDGADLETVGKGVISGNKLRIASGVEEIYNQSPDRFMTLVCIMEFVNRKPKAVYEIAEEAFAKKGQPNISDNGPIAHAYKLYEKDPKLLFDVYLRNQVIRKGFDSYKLISKKKSFPQHPLQKIDENRINTFLKDVDSQFNDGLESKCWHVSHYGSTTEVYLRRQDEPILLKKLLRNIRQTMASSTILRFDKHGRNVDLWSEKHSVAEKLLNHLSKKIFEKDAKYEPEVYRNSKADVKNWLGAIMHGQDSDMKLLKIKRRNAPIKGSPKITIESSRSIHVSLNSLKQAGIDLSKDCATETEEISIEYKSTKYLFGLRISNGSIVVYSKRQRGTKKAMESIITYLKKEYSIKISLSN